jgi:hypothetical protein
MVNLQIRLTRSGLATEIARDTYRGWLQILKGLQQYLEQRAPE